MSVDMMELKEEDLIDGALIWSAQDFMKYAKDAKLCLFT